MKILKLTLLFLIVLAKGFTQTPYITNFLPGVYKADPQNWAIVQDKRGVMYIGNGNGLLEYDGITWRFIKTPSYVASLAMDSTGRIYVGIKGDFGYLKADSLGSYQYQSLKEKIPQQHHEFNEVWKIYVSGNRIFFQSLEKIFILQNDRFKVVVPEALFHVSFLVDTTFYVREFGKGLMIYKNDSLQLAQGGERFADEKIYAMLPFRQNEILIATRTQGVWVYTPQQNTFYKPAGFEAIDKFLLQYPVYYGTALHRGNFALGTLTGGVIVFDAEGHIQNIYNTEAGLPDNAINTIYPDIYQQLWIGSDNGVSMVQNNLPFQRFTENDGLKGEPYCINFFNNRLYVGTTQYLCVRNEAGNFETIPGTEGQNWQLYHVNGKLLLVNGRGLFEVNEKQAIPAIESSGFVSLCHLNNKTDYLLAGLLPNGLYLLQYEQTNWKIKNKIKGFAKTGYKIVQGKEGRFWVFTQPGLYKLELNQALDSAISVIQCTPQQGLPTDKTVPYLLNSGEVVFSTEKGIYRYLSADDTFEPHPAFDMLTGDIDPFQPQKNGDIWFQEEPSDLVYEKGVLKYKNGKYQIIKQAFHKYNDDPITGFSNFYVDSDSSVFIGTNIGLLQYNPRHVVDYTIPFHTLIRRVLANDSLLFGGATNKTNEFEHIKGAEIAYRQNNLVFHYAATFYEDVEKNLYSYRLVGSGTAWSDWVSDVKKEYTFLAAGKYTFEVKSKNQYRVIGSTASYSFRILPPWYRTWWAYTLYILFLLRIIYAVAKLYSRRLQMQKEHLEEIVEERTSEISQQKEEIQVQSEQLKTQNHKLLALDEFKQGMTSMIVHDLKNPLNAIINTPEKYNKDEKIEIKTQYAKQMLNLVMNILDVNKYEETRMTVDLMTVSLYQISENAVTQVLFLANQKSIKLVNNIEQNTAVRADTEMLERIFVNLLTNAIKYSKLNSEIFIGTERSQITPKGIDHNHLTVKITDYGKGISEDNRHLVFQKFGQVEAKKSGKIRSTGIGLTFCKMAIEAHGGEIDFDSKEGKGTTFRFTLQADSDFEMAKEMKTVETSQKKSLDLSDKEKEYIQPFLKELSKYEIYRYTEIMAVLDRMESETENIANWKYELIKIVDTLNEEKYMAIVENKKETE